MNNIASRVKNSPLRLPAPRRPRQSARWVLVFLLALAAMDAQAGEVSVTVTPAIVSQYMFRGLRFGGPSFQPSAEVGIGNWTAGLWANEPIADRVPGLSDPELDPYLSYTWKLNEHLSVVPGVTAYIFPKADLAQGFYRSTYEPYVAASYSLGPAKLTPKVYYDLVLQGPTFELNASYKVPLKKLHTELNFSVTGGTYFWEEAVRNATPGVRNHGSYYLVGLTTPFTIHPHAQIVPGIAYTQGFDNYFESAGAADQRNPAAVGRAVASLCLVFTF